MTTAYPLAWPHGWPRARSQRAAPFKVSPSQAKAEMYAELQRLGARDIIVSTDQPLNRDGTATLRRSWSDPGVAVYFKRKGKPVVLACDQFDKMPDNMRAIGKTIEAMRGIERWGASDMLDRAFTGFTALAGPAASAHWTQVLNLPANTTRDQINAHYRERAKTAANDGRKLLELNLARDSAVAALPPLPSVQEPINGNG
jgi:hypothetical protein